MSFLLIVSGPNEGDFHPMSTDALMIGREDTCAIQILDDRVSRHHLEIRWNETAGQYLACDQKSANGVWINDERIAEDTVLNHGDIIGLGGSEIIFSDEDFIDRKSAVEHYERRRDERYRKTIVE